MSNDNARQIIKKFMENLNDENEKVFSKISDKIQEMKESDNNSFLKLKDKAEKYFKIDFDKITFKNFIDDLIAIMEYEEGKEEEGKERKEGKEGKEGKIGELTDNDKIIISNEMLDIYDETTKLLDQLEEIGGGIDIKRTQSYYNNLIMLTRDYKLFFSSKEISDFRDRLGSHWVSDDVNYSKLDDEHLVKFALLVLSIDLNNTKKIGIKTRYSMLPMLFQDLISDQFDYPDDFEKKSKSSVELLIKQGYKINAINVFKLFIFYKQYSKELRKEMNDKNREKYFKIFEKLVDEVIKELNLDKKIVYSMKYKYINVGEGEHSFEDILNNIFDTFDWNMKNYLIIIRENVEFSPFLFSIGRIIDLLQNYYKTKLYNKRYYITYKILDNNRNAILSLHPLYISFSSFIKNSLDKISLEIQLEFLMEKVYTEIVNDTMKQLNINPYEEKKKFRINHYFEFGTGDEVSFKEILSIIVKDEIWINVLDKRIYNIFDIISQSFSEIKSFISKYYPNISISDIRDFSYFSMYHNLNKILAMKSFIYISDMQIENVKETFEQITKNRQKRLQRKRKKMVIRDELKALSANLPKNIDGKLMKRFKYMLEKLFPICMNEDIKSSFIMNFIKMLNDNNVLFILGNKEFRKKVVKNDVFLYTFKKFYEQILNYTFPYNHNLEETSLLFFPDINLDAIKELYKETGFIFIEEKYRQTIIGQCTNDTDVITLLPFENNLDTLSIKIEDEKHNKRIYCYDRESLISFWNQEAKKWSEHASDETPAFLYGDCKFNEDDEVIPGSCKKFYKLPYPEYFISEGDKNKIEDNKKYTFWKMVPNKTVKIGRYHGIGSVEGDKLIYKILHPIPKLSGRRN